MFSKICIIFVAISVVKLQQFEKPGNCPASTEIGICATVCTADLDCRGNAKCCDTSCGGAVCTRPIKLPNSYDTAEKPGYCPERPTGPWVCSSRCSKDSNCMGKLKCCKNRCGAMACIKPEGL